MAACTQALTPIELPTSRKMQREGFLKGAQCSRTMTDLVLQNLALTFQSTSTDGVPSL